MEAVKGVIFDRGEGEIEGHKVHKYLVTMMVVTDKPLDPLPPESIIMSLREASPASDFLFWATKYKVPYAMGDVMNAIMSVVDMKPEDLELLAE